MPNYRLRWSVLGLVLGLVVGLSLAPGFWSVYAVFAGLIVGYEVGAFVHYRDRRRHPRRHEVTVVTGGHCVVLDHDDLDEYLEVER